MSARRRAPPRRRRSGRCSGRPTHSPARRRAARPGRGRAGWRAGGGRARRARPASSTARHWSASNAPSSQKASTQRACGAQAASIGPQTSADVVVGPALELGRDDVGAEERRLVASAGRRPAEHRASSVGRQAVARLDLDRRDARAGRFVPQAAGAGQEVGVRWPPGWPSTVVRMPPAEYGAPAMRATNSSPRSPANTRWVWLSTNPGITHRPAASIRSSRGRRRAVARWRRRPRRP